MENTSAKQVLSNLYGLIMEINLHRSDEDVLRELQENPDSQIEKHLQRIKILNAKVKAQANVSRFQKAKEQLKLLKVKGIEELKKLIQPQQQTQFMPLFRKFEELTLEDEAAILEDQELLQLMEILNNSINDSSKS